MPNYTQHDRTKPTLQEIRNYYHISLTSLAQAAGVEPIKIQLMELRGYVRGYYADKVLAALSHITKWVWTRENVGGFKVYREHGLHGCEQHGEMWGYITPTKNTTPIPHRRPLMRPQKSY